MFIASHGHPALVCAAGQTTECRCLQSRSDPPPRHRRVATLYYRSSQGAYNIYGSSVQPRRLTPLGRCRLLRPANKVEKRPPWLDRRKHKINLEGVQHCRKLGHLLSNFRGACPRIPLAGTDASDIRAGCARQPTPLLSHALKSVRYFALHIVFQSLSYSRPKDRGSMADIYARSEQLHPQCIS